MLRPAQKSDWPRLKCLFDKCFANYGPDPGCLSRCLQDSLYTPRFDFMQVACTTWPVGFCAGGMVEKKKGLIQFLAVDHMYHRQKLATRLLTRVCESLTDAGADEIVLNVAANNRGAIEFYEEYGFVRSARGTNGAAGGGSHQMSMNYG